MEEQKKEPGFCEHWDTAEPGTRFHIKHHRMLPNGDLEDCESYYGACGDCAAHIKLVLLRRFMAYVDQENFSVMECFLDPEKKHPFIEHDQFVVSEVTDILHEGKSAMRMEPHDNGSS